MFKKYRKKTIFKIALPAIGLVFLSTAWVMGATNLLDLTPAPTIETQEPINATKQQPVSNQTTKETTTSNTETSELRLKPYKNGVNVVKELIERRTEHSKTFKNNDGTLTTYFASEPIHYYENNQWSNRKTTLVRDESEPDYGYAIKENEYKVKFPKHSGKSLQYQYENNTVQYQAEQTNDVVPVTNGNKITYTSAWMSGMRWRTSQFHTKRLLI